MEPTERTLGLAPSRPLVAEVEARAHLLRGEMEVRAVEEEHREVIPDPVAMRSNREKTVGSVTTVAMVCLVVVTT